MATQQLQLGARVLVGEHKATVRFIGAVQGTEGEWIGVEWDDDTRGKHDGSRDGIRYFSCKTPSPTAASFVRPKKVNMGIPISKAIKERYGATSEQDETEISFRDGRQARVDVTLVGAKHVEKKLSSLHQLLEVFLRGDAISKIDTNLADLVPKLVTVDLTDNLIWNSQQIHDLLSQLPALQNLTISNNRFEEFDVSIFGADDQFKHLTRINASNTGIDWPTMCAFAAHTPALRELHFCENGVESLIPPESLHELETLNLYGNTISSWDEVLKLRSLPNLKTLMLNHNQLGDLTEPIPEFPSLISLSLSGNLVTSWQTIALLGKHKNITEYRLRQNPVGLQQKEAESRRLMIAFLPHVQWLNGSEVTVRERQVAERYYLSHFAEAWYEARDDPQRLEEFIKLHSRFDKLVTELGEPAPLQKSLPTLRDRLLHLRVEHQGTVQTFAVPPQTTVAQLTRLLSMRGYANALETCFVAHGTKDQEIRLDDEFRDLHFYSIPKHATLHFSPKAAPDGALTV